MAIDPPGGGTRIVKRLTAKTTEMCARVVGRYALHDVLATGGMASVHLGRLMGAVGFARTVAIKRLHPHLAADPEFSAMLIDEARLAVRIRHPNVVQTLDIVPMEGELLLVMEYVHGLALAQLLKGADGKRMPPAVASAILIGVLDGLHAAHEATNDAGDSLGMVHRDISPQNVLIGADGTPRVLDFGIATAADRIHTTRDGAVKGKVAYMPPEQLRGKKVTRHSDVYAAGVVLWECLTGRRLFTANTRDELVERVLLGMIKPPSKFAPSLAEAVDGIVLRALDRDPEERFATAREMALALEECLPPASPRQVADWVAKTADTELTTRAALVARVERSSQAPPPAMPSSLTSVVHEASQTGSSAIVPRRAKPRLGAYAGAIAVVLATLGIGLVVIRARPAGAPSPEIQATQPVLPPVVASQPATPPLPPADVPPAASASSAPSVPPPSPASGRHAGPRDRGKPAAPKCVVRTIDANGIVRYHPECAP